LILTNENSPKIWNVRLNSYPTWKKKGKWKNSGPNTSPHSLKELTNPQEQYWLCVHVSTW